MMTPDEFALHFDQTHHVRHERLTAQVWRCLECAELTGEDRERVEMAR